MARKILLADDSVTAQNMGRKILADAGYEVITVNNGSAALKKIGEQRPDLIVLDVYMPGYSGLEVCQRLKEVGDSARIPILLTVGKLEPFKPEEARRVRADGFIVKPFEASELLSALSKLEDKIVPRAENSKPGRFARVTASIEEGRRDPNLPDDEDSGWRSRISFPTKKKKEAAPQEDGDDPAIYNPVNKDLRTVVEHHPQPVQSSAVPPQAESEKEKVDVGALAPEGLPKDVTPEEIAAIAAAAAQIQGKVLEMKVAEPQPEIPPAELVSSTTEAQVSEPATQATSAISAAADEGAPEAKPEVATVSAPPADTVQTVSAVGELSQPSATNADQPEAATMAAAAGAESTGSVSHWTAVAVALAPEEAGISLEQEMQKAYAEFAAAATQPAEAIEPETPASSTASSAEATMAVAPEAAPENLREVAVAATEAIDAAVKEIDAVAASYATEGETGPQPPVESEASEPASEQPVAESAPEPVEEVKVEAPAETEPEAVASQPTETPAAATEGDASVSESQPEAGSEEFPVVNAESEAEVSESAVSESEPEPPSTPHEAHKDTDIAATTAAAWASWRRIRESGESHPQPTSVEDSKDAAMAAAAGAETIPEESKESDPEISSIVDSVLADLRPKIVEEISRKLGKKK